MKAGGMKAKYKILRSMLASFKEIVLGLTKSK
jgi:hypothetical protein